MTFVWQIKVVFLLFEQKNVKSGNKKCVQWVFLLFNIHFIFYYLSFFSHLSLKVNQQVLQEVLQLLVLHIFLDQILHLLFSFVVYDLEFVVHNQVDDQVFLYHIVFRLYRVQYNFPEDYQLNYLLNLIVYDMLDLFFFVIKRKIEV